MGSRAAEARRNRGQRFRGARGTSTDAPRRFRQRATDQAHNSGSLTRPARHSEPGRPSRDEPSRPPPATPRPLSPRKTATTSNRPWPTRCGSASRRIVPITGRPGGCRNRISVPPVAVASKFTSVPDARFTSAALTVAHSRLTPLAPPSEPAGFWTRSSRRQGRAYRANVARTTSIGIRSLDQLLFSALSIGGESQ